MKILINWLIVLSIFYSAVCIASNKVQKISVSNMQNVTQINFDCTTKAKYKMYTLSNPDRIVIDFADTKLQANVNKIALSGTGIKQIRSGFHANKLLRIVLDIEANYKPKMQSILQNGQHSLQVSFVYQPLKTTTKSKAIKTNKSIAQPSTVTTTTAVAPIAKKSPEPIVARNTKFLIAIDAGHGGHDPGAIGHRGTKEKDIALQISRSLYTILNKQNKLQAYMIRDKDHYLNFRQRMQRARNMHADLFVSIHADSFYKKSADGASVFVLSSNKASSVAARWLVASENRTEFSGGLSLKDKNSMLKSVLFDLTQTASAVGSMEAASAVLKSLRGVTKLHTARVESGAFLVLRSPDFPSILVEAGFLSNPETELKLRDAKYQQKIAQAVADGINNYFKYKTPVG